MRGKRSAQHLIDDSMDGLRLQTDDRVLEIGAGPGYVRLALPSALGPLEPHAVDLLCRRTRLPGAAATERGVRQIERIAADAATLEPTALRPARH